MATPKTQPTDEPVDAFLDRIADTRRREDTRAAIAIAERQTGETAVMWGTAIVGFGVYQAATAPWPAVALAARKQALVIYAGDFDDRDDVLRRLGRHSTGKGCIYLPALADVDTDVLGELFGEAYAARSAA